MNIRPDNSKNRWLFFKQILSDAKLLDFLFQIFIISGMKQRIQICFFKKETDKILYDYFVDAEIGRKGIEFISADLISKKEFYRSLRSKLKDKSLKCCILVGTVGLNNWGRFR